MIVRAPSFRIRGSFDVAFSADGGILASASRDMHLWNVQTRQQIRKFKIPIHTAYISFAHSSDTTVVKNTKGDIVIYLPQGEIATEITRTYDEGCRVLFSPDDEYVIDGSWTGNISVTHCQTGEQVYQETFSGAMITELQYSPSAQQYAWLSTPRGNASDAIQEQIVISRWPFGKQKDVYVPLNGQRVSAFAFNQAGTHIALLRDNTVMEIVVLLNKQPVASLSLPSRCKALAWAPDEKQITVVGHESVYILDYPSLRITHRLVVPYACAVAYTPSSETIAIGSWEKGLVLHRQNMAQYAQE